MRRIYTGLLMTVLLSGFVSAQAQEHAALTLVKETTKNIKQKIKEKDEAINKDPEVLYDLVNTIVLPHFDFRKMSSWVLGKNWRKADEKQKKDFS